MESVVFAGMKTPSSRKDLMLDMRRSEEAEGERRMMGCSARRDDDAFLVSEEIKGGCGAEEVLDVGLLRVERKVEAVLR